MITPAPRSMGGTNDLGEVWPNRKRSVSDLYKWAGIYKAVRTWVYDDDAHAMLTYKGIVSALINTAI